MTLLMGLRAGEVVSRIVRDLDDDGRLLWIPDSKTEAGKRTLQVPDLLRQYLLALAEGRGPEDLLFGAHSVAAALGHESVTTTLQSYAKSGAGAGARQRKVLTVLAGGQRNEKRASDALRLKKPE